MSKTAEKDPKAAEKEQAPKKGKKKLLVIAVAVVVLLAAAGYFLLGGSGGEEKAEPEKPKEGIVVKLDPIHINLADGHFLKLGLALQATEAAHEEPDGSKALDIAIAQFSNREVRELASNEHRAEAKEKLTKAVAKAYHDEIMEVYFTEFVMQ
jgi:flagellar FliL protein